MKFKEGDKVRVVSNPGCLRIGDIGVLRKRKEGTYSNGYLWDVIVKLEEDSWDNFKECEIEHVRIANTKITRKLYPNYKEDGEYLILC